MNVFWTEQLTLLGFLLFNIDGEYVRRNGEMQREKYMELQSNRKADPSFILLKLKNAEVTHDALLLALKNNWSGKQIVGQQNQRKSRRDFPTKFSSFIYPVAKFIYLFFFSVRFAFRFS